jgi:hypothetical protein
VVSISVRVSAWRLPERPGCLRASAGDAARSVRVCRRVRRGDCGRLRRRLSAAEARARAARNRHPSSRTSHAAAAHLLQPGIDPHDTPDSESAGPGRTAGTTAGATRLPCDVRNASALSPGTLLGALASERSCCACSRATLRSLSTASRGEDRSHRTAC